MIGEAIRKYGFWAMDFLQRGQISRPYNDIKEIIENREIGDKKADEYLDNILSHAVNTTKYYEKYRGYKNLNDFSVITKKDIKNEYEDFFSNKYKRENLVRIFTSGSYGTPFIFYLTKERKVRQTAEVLYFGKWSNYDIGMKYAYFRGVNSKSESRSRIQNEYFIFSRILDDEWKKNTRELLKKEKIKVLFDFPTAISTIAQYCNEQGDKPKDFSIVGVATSSEPLHESQRNIIESTFGCNCLSRYSTEELGVLANECPTCKKHHINTASFKIEVLDLDNDEPAKEGEVGRIIVTDLFSHAMPLIRYETGDLGILAKDCECGLKGPCIKSLQGRSSELVYNTNGTTILPFFIEDIMEDYTGILQYQFIQYDKKDYVLKVVNTRNAEFDIDKVTNYIKFWMGEDANINIDFVGDIEMLKSGKRPYVVNYYKPEKIWTMSLIMIFLLLY